MKGAIQNIPDILIYEMVNGKPIYYNGYKDYLNGKKQIGEIMGCSKLQSLIITKLIVLLSTYFGDDYYIFTNEIGIQFSKKSWRSADIAVVKADKVLELNDKYLDVAPEIVIEIDTKADLAEIKNPLGYYQEKTDELIKFGVDKVVWIFTETNKILVAEKNKAWTIIDWTDKIEIKSGLELDLNNLIKRTRKK